MLPFETNEPLIAKINLIRTNILRLENDMSEAPIRYGVVGLGRSGWNIHVKNLRPRDDAQIVAVADPVEEPSAE